MTPSRNMSHRKKNLSQTKSSPRASTRTKSHRKKNVMPRPYQGGIIG